MRQVKIVISIILCFSLSGCGLARYYEAKAECNRGNRYSCQEAAEFSAKMAEHTEGMIRYNERQEQLNQQRRLNDAYVRHLNNANNSSTPSYSNCTTMILRDGTGGGLAQTMAGAAGRATRPTI